MLAENELPPYDGPFNAWLLQYAQGQVVVHAARVEEHQKQLSYHERQLRYWEQMNHLLLAGQGSTVPQSLPLPPSPNMGVTAKQDNLGRVEARHTSRVRHSPPTSFRNPFTPQEDASVERDQERARLEQQEEEERRLQEEQNSLQGVEYGQGPEADFPAQEPEMDPLVLEAENAAREAEEALREAAEAEAIAAQAREEAERANAEAEAARLAEEEELRRQEAEEEAKRQQEEEAKRQQQEEEAKRQQQEEEAKRQQEEEARRHQEPDKQSLPEPEEDYPPHPTSAMPAVSPTIAPPAATPHSPPVPVARKPPPATSPSLHADAAAVASTSIKERMARMGGLNPLAMMPVGPGMPIIRPKRTAEENGGADDSSHGRQDGLRSTQEMKPISVDPSKPTGEQPPKSPLVKGPAPPPRKPGGANPSSPQPSNPTPPPKEAAKPAADSSHSSQSASHSQSSSKPASPAEPVRPAPALPAKKYCKANFDLDNPPKGCPKFKKGDFAECIEVKGEWSHVIFVKSGEEGHVPTAYFSMDVPLPTTPAAKKMKALFPFVPPKPKGFVPLKVGEIVTLEKGEIGEEWWIVKNAAGLSGYVPHNYVKVI